MLANTLDLCSVEEAADPFHDVLGSIRGIGLSHEPVDDIRVVAIPIWATAFDTFRTIVVDFDAFEQVHALDDDSLIHFYQMEQCGYDPGASNEIADGFAWAEQHADSMKQLHRYATLMDSNATPIAISVRVNSEPVLDYIRQQRPHLLVELDL